MEINLTDRQKIILEGIVRSCIFLVMMRELSFLILRHITGKIIDLISYIVSLVPDIDRFIHISEDVINIYFNSCRYINIFCFLYT